MKIIIIILIVIWLISFIKFKSKMRYFRIVASILEQRNSESGGSDADILLRLSSAYIVLQQYQKAYGCLTLAKNSGQLTEEEMSKVQANIDFCEKPISSFTAGGRNRNTYFHYFFLNRFGRRRFNFLKKEDLDEADIQIKTKGV